MKKTLNNIFDEANANELEKLVSQNAASEVSADTLSLIKNKVYAKTGITKAKTKKSIAFRWQSYVAVAACFLLIVSAVITLPMLLKDDQGGVFVPGTTNNLGDVTPPDNSDHTPIIIDTTKSPEKLYGSNSIFVVGSSDDVGGTPSSAPPAFRFEETNFVVKARVVENYPDIYYKLDVTSTYKPTAYRLIQMECLEVIRGTSVPKDFLYLIPDSLFVDMSGYDSLLISMDQLGAQNYVLRNDTQNQMEALSLMIFDDYQDSPELGNMIAFSDGVFDESLWKNKSWLYGYQFARHYLETNTGRLVVYRGGTEDEAIAEIHKRIQAHGEGYLVPDVISLDFSTQEAKDVLEYVKPFANGVFSQRLIGSGVIFTRYINGCQTEETIKIDSATEEVTHSDVSYTIEDLASIENIGLYISEKAGKYAEGTPPPPHTDPKGKILLSLHLYGWYAKVNSKTYGVIKTVWRHMEESDVLMQYYDEEYILYDMSESTAQNVTREYLVSILGPRNLGKGEFGIGIEMPMC